MDLPNTEVDQAAHVPVPPSSCVRDTQFVLAAAAHPQRAIQKSEAVDLTRLEYAALVVWFTFLMSVGLSTLNAVANRIQRDRCLARSNFCGEHHLRHLEDQSVHYKGSLAKSLKESRAW